MTVPFLDMRRQVASMRADIDAAVARVLDSGLFILGPEVEALERELAAALGAGDVVAVGNGTEAIQLALQALGVGRDDEVVTSPLTAAFTALAVVAAGARPVFADVEPETLTLSAAAVERALSTRTRAILPVHLYGHPADLDPLLDLGLRRGIPVVEDACQAHGATYRGRPVGSLGALGTLSFYPTKNLGALGDGGAILVGEPSLAARLRRMRNGGQTERYRHEEPGLNSRLDELQAAILRARLPRLAGWTDRRRALAGFYREALSGLPLVLPPEAPEARPVYHLFVVRHPRRDVVRARLEERGIATLVHYPLPLHLQPAFADSGGREGDHPVAERAAREVFSLPLYPEMTDEQARQVTDALREVLRSLPA